MDEVPLKEHLESRFHAHEAVHVQEAVARNEASRRIDARLEALNELRAEVITDRGRLVSREVFDSKLEAIDTRIDVLHDQITEWKGQRKGLSLFASVLIGLAGFIATVLAIYFALN